MVKCSPPTRTSASSKRKDSGIVKNKHGDTINAKRKEGCLSRKSVIKRNRTRIKPNRTRKNKLQQIDSNKGGKRDSPSLPKGCKPPKFSWVVEGLLAGQGRPTKPGHMRYLCENGIKYMVTLTMNKPRALAEYPGDGLEWVHIPIQDECPPSLIQIKLFVETVDKAKSEGVGVSTHCAWGRGRTGTMIACYFVKCHQDHDPDQAISRIRTIRPGSIDTETQVKAVHQYAAHLKAIKTSDQE